jgi:hypothetical protein
MASAAAGSRPGTEYLLVFIRLAAGTTYYWQSGHGTHLRQTYDNSKASDYWSFTTTIYRRLNKHGAGNARQG